MSHDYYVLAYYLFVNIEDPLKEVERHKEFFENKEVTGRIYISHQGINGQMSGTIHDAQAYMDWMHTDSRFKELEFKIRSHHEQAYPRMTVKYRKQLVAVDVDTDLSLRGEYASPRRWREMLESDENYLLLDIRNKYEWDIGHFEGAEPSPCETFREFPEYAEQLREKHDPKTTKVMMYCTGGIRCELFSALLKEKGFQTVYQLHGGVEKYGHEEKGKHWRGKLFVFDDRLAIPLSAEEKVEQIGSCHYCNAASDKYYNCANMDCNELFICCPSCLHKQKGCCQATCLEAPRVRPLQAQDTYKPFRKKHLYQK